MAILSTFNDSRKHNSIAIMKLPDAKEPSNMVYYVHVVYEI